MKMKRSIPFAFQVLSFTTALCLLAVMYACAAPARSLLAITFPTYQILRQLTSGIPDVRAELMLPAGTGCPHEYALTPRDINKLARADAVVVNGLGLEAFVKPALSGMSPGPVVLDASDGLQNLLPDRARGDVHQTHGAGQLLPDSPAESNPHLFASPRRVAAMTRSLAEQLAAQDPEHAAQYRENARIYAVRMNTLADEFSALGKRLQNTRIVTMHGIFDYLAQDMGLQVVAVVQANEDQQPSAADMLRLIREMREKNVGAVFTEPQYPDKMAHTLAREAGIPAADLDPVADGPDDAATDYYETRMRQNMRILEQTLGIR